MVLKGPCGCKTKPTCFLRATLFDASDLKPAARTDRKKRVGCRFQADSSFNNSCLLENYHVA